MNWKRSLKIIATGVFLALPWVGAQAQQVNMYWNTGTGGPSAWQPVSTANPFPVTGTFSATTTGFPGTTQTTGTPISVTTGGVSGTLPSGAVVVASNVGATNNAFCKLGASATTSDQLIAPNSWFGFTVGSNTQLTCITSTSTTTVNMVGGAGLPTGAGGGGGGGSGGNVTIVGPLGQALAAASVPVVLTAAQITTLTPPTTVTANQGTPTNWAMNIAQINGITPLMGNGVTGTGSPRVTIASDNTAFSVNATLSAETTKVIGTVNQGTSPWVISGALTANQSVNVNQWDGTALGVPTAYGTAPTTGNYLGVNAFVTNTNANGQAVMASSSPVVVASNQSPIPTSGAVNVTATDCSGTVATGGTAVNAFTAQTTLHGFTIVNTNTSEVMWISFTTTAAASTAGSYPIPAATATTFAGGGSFTSPPGFGLNHALSVVAATSAHTFSCTWY